MLIYALIGDASRIEGASMHRGPAPRVPRASVEVSLTDVLHNFFQTRTRWPKGFCEMISAT